ncbi:MAG: cob(I)yrinic acid a,c-diamide adenosyltransferase [Halobacteriaceae archaeon]
MRVYTGRGDEGRTDLHDQSRVSKASPRVEAYGTVDEVNALVGRVRPTGHDDVDDHLRRVQDHLHVVQADLANPDGDGPRVTDGHVEALEEWMDGYDAELDPLSSFVLPGGCPAGADLHHARTVCRRAERRTVALAGEQDVDDAVLAYLNRLSDALFVLARVVNAREGVPEESPEYGDP